MNIEFFCTQPHGPAKEGQFEGGVGVYLHGQAEDEAGFDIPDSGVDLNTLEDGIYQAALNGNDGYTLFLWRSSLSMGLLRGLVAKNSDANGLAEAAQRYELRPNFL